MESDRADVKASVLNEQQMLWQVFAEAVFCTVNSRESNHCGEQGGEEKMRWDSSEQGLGAWSNI